MTASERSISAAGEIAMPVLGLSSEDEYPTDAHLQSFVAHVAFGITAEFVRRGVRALLAREPGGAFERAR